MARSRRTKIPVEVKMRAVLSGRCPTPRPPAGTGYRTCRCRNGSSSSSTPADSGSRNDPSGPAGHRGSLEERRLRSENEQLKLALAEATVQLRIWQHGAKLVDEVPSQPSNP
ncbi:hypothetical protein P9209_16040 [Prescottella defluvii]|nr:hypothetical protein P9209_16040 [Prescottella defluvii]